jgi:hypothetical protein
MELATYDVGLLGKRPMQGDRGGNADNDKGVKRRPQSDETLFTVVAIHYELA